MELSRTSNDKKLELCRWYFKVGFLFLPFVWTINAFWFFDCAFKQTPFDEQKTIRKYVIGSAIGALIWIILLSTWIVVYQTNRAEWGEFGDSLSIVMPIGYA